MGSPVIHKLTDIITHLNFNADQNSLTIYVSPVFEKVLYLNTAVKEKLTVTDSFAIRDLVYNKKQLRQYLVFLLSGKESRIYPGNSNNLVRIVSNTPQSISANANKVQ